MRKYNRGLDIGRLVFACLIPFLHIPFADGLVIEIIRQYFSRLGVPFSLRFQDIYYQGL